MTDIDPRGAMTDPDRAGGRDPLYDDPYERGKLDQASCGWILLAAFILVALVVLLLYVLLLLEPSTPYPPEHR
ncbi:hypothetical protein AB0F46_36340 [Streptomyces sp. NPDC026665]|uniref:hypothetical protein n=1 Tax=Streptomyces sp. NPDC026665 TaxID=3154798 RepID=UPI0033CB73D1